MHIQELQIEDGREQELSNTVEPDPNSQTEAINSENNQLPPGEKAPSDAIPPILQTDIEHALEDIPDQDPEAQNPDLLQTEKKPARKRASSVKAPGKKLSRTKKASDDSGSGSEEESGPLTNEAPSPDPAHDAELGQEPVPVPRQPRTSPRRARRNDTIISIDEERSVQTSEDKHQSDLLDLVESMKSHKILTGTIQGVERSDENPNNSFAVIYHGEFKVIIPSDEAVEPPADFRGRLPGEVMQYLITKRLGAEVDYIVKGIDAETGIAAASRLDAMASKRKAYYYGSDRDGNNLLYEGLTAEARVVSVIRAGIFVDLFGVEAYIPLRELSYQRWVDATSHYQAGQRELVKILDIDRSDRSHIKVSASVKQAGKNPYETALRRYAIGNRYVGTVSMVDVNGVFVALDGGIDCLCTHPKRGRPPRGCRVTVRILGINHETNRIWGAITHMTNR